MPPLRVSHPAFRSGGGQAGGRAGPRRRAGRWSEGALRGSGKMAGGGGGGGGYRDSLFLEGACKAPRRETWPASCVSLLAISKGARCKVGNGGGGRVSSYGVGGGGYGSPLGATTMRGGFVVGEGWLPWLGLVKRDLLLREGLVRAIWFIFLFSFFLSFTVPRRWECGVSFLCRGTAESSPGLV